MFKFNNNHIFTGYIKQLLASFNLPSYKVYTRELEEYYNNYGKEDPRVAASAPKTEQGYPDHMCYVNYIKDGMVQRYDGTVWTPTQYHYHYNKKELNKTRNLKIRNNIYDSYTHEYLGEYLRFQRDYNNLDLMPLYNCFSDTLCPLLRTTFDAAFYEPQYKLKAPLNFEVDGKTYYAYTNANGIRYGTTEDCGESIELKVGEKFETLSRVYLELSGNSKNIDTIFLKYCSSPRLVLASVGFYKLESDSIENSTDKTWSISTGNAFIDCTNNNIYECCEEGSETKELTDEKVYTYKTVTFDTKDTSCKIYMLPVKLFQKYTIALNSPSAEIFCGFYSGNYFNEKASLKTVPKITYHRYTDLQFANPIVYDKLSVDNILATEAIAGEYLQNEATLKMFIKLPVNTNSSIVVLEGDYSSYNNTIFSQATTWNDGDPIPDELGAPRTTTDTQHAFISNYPYAGQVIVDVTQTATREQLKTGEQKKDSDTVVKVSILDDPVEEIYTEAMVESAASSIDESALDGKTKEEAVEGVLFEDVITLANKRIANDLKFTITPNQKESIFDKYNNSHPAKQDLGANDKLTTPRLSTFETGFSKFNLNSPAAIAEDETNPEVLVLTYKPLDEKDSFNKLKITLPKKVLEHDDAEKEEVSLNTDEIEFCFVYGPEIEEEEASGDDTKKTEYTSIKFVIKDCTGKIIHDDVPVSATFSYYNDVELKTIQEPELDEYGNPVFEEETIIEIIDGKEVKKTVVGDQKYTDISLPYIFDNYKVTLPLIHLTKDNCKIDICRKEPEGKKDSDKPVAQAEANNEENTDTVVEENTEESVDIRRLLFGTCDFIYTNPDHKEGEIVPYPAITQQGFVLLKDIVTESKDCQAEFDVSRANIDLSTKAILNGGTPKKLGGKVRIQPPSIPTSSKAFDYVYKNDIGSTAIEYDYNDYYNITQYVQLNNATDNIRVSVLNATTFYIYISGSSSLKNGKIQLIDLNATSKAKAVVASADINSKLSPSASTNELEAGIEGTRVTLSAPFGGVFRISITAEYFGEAYIYYIEAKNDLIFKGAFDRKANKYVVNFEEGGEYTSVENRAFSPITTLQLLQLNTGTSYPIADKLLDYLVFNAITHLDDNADNIKRVQKVMSNNGHTFEYDGAWETKMRSIIYSYMTEGKPTGERFGSDIDHDVLGYVDKDVEKYYTSWKAEALRDYKGEPIWYRDKDGKPLEYTISTRLAASDGSQLTDSPKPGKVQATDANGNPQYKDGAPVYKVIDGRYLIVDTATGKYIAKVKYVPTATIANVNIYEDGE